MFSKPFLTLRLSHIHWGWGYSGQKTEWPRPRNLLGRGWSKPRNLLDRTDNVQEESSPTDEVHLDTTLVNLRNSVDAAVVSNILQE